MPQVVASALVCSACSEPLGENGVCIACLLRAGLDECDATEHLDGQMIFGDFAVERSDEGVPCELGRGAMGVTYRALDKVLSRTVALKVIEPPNAADSQTVRERFLREARAAAALRHPNIAAVYQFGASTDSDRCYCAMELVEGETLDALVRREGPLKPESVLEIATQVASALVAASDRGLVHRDLKPGNIMLACCEGTGRFEAKVIDFGLAKAVSAAGEMELTHGSFVGTPAFASPEQFTHGAIDARTDIYALGVTTWFALTGRLPFPGTSIAEIRQRQTQQSLPLEQLRARTVPRTLIELICSCLAFDPADRPASARELAGALETCRTGVTKRRIKRKLALVTCAAAIGFLAASFGIWRQNSSPSDVSPPWAGLTNPNGPALPTKNAQAYLLFLRAREINPDSNQRKKALDLYAQAVALDPKFALARARFSIVANAEAHELNDQQWQRKARVEAEEALRLQPSLGEAHLAIANCYLFEGKDAPLALGELNRAAALLPNSVEVQLMAAWVLKAQNRFRERIAALRRAEAIDPNYVQAHKFLVLTFRWVRDWQQAMDEWDRFSVVLIHPNSKVSATRWCRANDEFRMSGNIDVLKHVLVDEEREPEKSRSQLNLQRSEVAMLERDYAAAAKLLRETQGEDFGKLSGITSHRRTFHEALAAVARGADPAEQQESLARAEGELQTALQQPNDYDDTRRLAELAIIHAFAGRKEEAVREMIRAIDLAPGAPGSIEKNGFSAALALVYARTGETDRALDLIQHLLTVPCELQTGAIYNMTLVDLRWRWIWDPLRSNPRFQKLLAGAEPRTIY
jgi:serine/threonine protein kinase